MKKNIGYKYLDRFSADLVVSKKQRANSHSVGTETLSPRLSNVDYLVLKERSRIIRGWAESIPKDNSVLLDIGGRIQPYKRLFKDITRVYISLDRQFEGLIDILARAENLPIKTESIDIVLCTQTLSYIRSPNTAVDEMYRVLRPGGQLILSAPSFFPAHHDEIWRFLPAAYEHLLERFSKIAIEPEGNSSKGLLRTLNVALHADIEGYRKRMIVEKTSIPMINMLGLVLGFIGKQNTRCTANYCVLAHK